MAERPPPASPPPHQRRLRFLEMWRLLSVRFHFRRGSLHLWSCQIHIYALALALALNLVLFEVDPFVGGKVIRGDEVIRHPRSKFKLTLEEYPHQYFPDFCPGESNVVCHVGYGLE